jgi:hypothetical protein
MSFPGSISGVVQVRFQVPPGAGPLVPATVTPTVLGNNLRARVILIWTRSN